MPLLPAWWEDDMAAKLSEGDTVGMTGEITIVHDDGSVTGCMVLVYRSPLAPRILGSR